MRKYIDVVKHLVEKEANIECEDNDGMTPLFSASF
jgi:ankyrin repeat protein